MNPPPIEKAQSDDDLEHAMTELGRARYRDRVAKAGFHGRRSGTQSGQAMLRRAVADLDAGIKAWAAKARRRKGAAHPSLPYLAGFRRGVVAMLTARTVVDGIALQMPLVSVANAVGQALEEERFHRAIQAASKDRERMETAQGTSGENTLWTDFSRRLRRTSRGRRSHKRRMARDMAAKLRAEYEPWPRRERLRLGILLVELMRLHTGLVAVETVPRSGRKPQAMVLATPLALNWLEQQDAKNELLSPVWLPMRSRPADWTGLYGGGYRLQSLRRSAIVKTADRAALSAVRDADPRIVYRAASAVQRTGWRVNRRVLAAAQALWDAGAPVPGFREFLEDPFPARPAATREEDPAGWDRWVRAAADWRRAHHQNNGRRVGVAKTMHLARAYRDAPAIYFPHQADFRGRLYPIPFFLQPQGDDLARGLLEFAKGKPVRDRAAADHLRGAGAGLFGVNRVATARKVEWAHGHHNLVLAAAADPVANRWWLDAESPFQFLAWCCEYADWFAAPATFESRARVNLDGSCNGLQLYSLLTRDEEGAAATNVTPADEPRDIYQVVADRATASLMEDPRPEAALWIQFLDGAVPRRYAKRPTMTLPYGSTFHSCITYTRQEYEADRVRKVSTPFEALNGGGYRACAVLAEHLWDAIGKTVGKAHEAMTWLRGASDILTAAGEPIAWTAPSGWPVVQRYTKYSRERISTAVGDTVRFVRYREDKGELARKQQANGIAPNFVHSIDAAILAVAVCRAKERGVESFAVVHDSFGVLAADAETMGQTLRDAVVDVFARDVLADFKEQVQRTSGVALPELPEYGTLDVSLARGARYFYA